MATCRICGGPVTALDLCNKHYIAYKKYGDPLYRLNARNKLFENRFKINPTTGCWIWDVANPDQRYGWWKTHGELKAHRASWVMHNGVIPEGMQVLHKCDTPRCVNPDHLFLGSQVTNMADMKAKHRGRNSSGENNTNARLCALDVRAIRADTRANPVIAEEYKIHRETVGRIKRRELWPSVV